MNFQNQARRRALAQWRGWDWSGEEGARRSAVKSAASLVPRMLQDLRIERRLAETEILKVWRHALDPDIVAHAQPTGLRNGTLFVAVDSSAWLDEIVRYRRHEILERLQMSFGKDLVLKISYRQG